WIVDKSNAGGLGVFYSIHTHLFFGCTAKKSAGNHTYCTLRHWYTRQRISERPRHSVSVPTYLSRCLKNYQFSMWDLKQKHFKFFYIFNHKDNKANDVQQYYISN